LFVFFHEILDEHVWKFEETVGFEDRSCQERGAKKYGNEEGR
jgi:hypothetical protein